MRSFIRGKAWIGLIVLLGLMSSRVGNGADIFVALGFRCRHHERPHH